MSYILTHQPLNVRLLSKRMISHHHDIMAPVPKKRSPLKSSENLPNLLIDHQIRSQKIQGRSGRKSNSNFSLQFMAQEAHTLHNSSCGNFSMSKVGGSITPHSDPLTHKNAVFDGQITKTATPALLKNLRPMKLLNEENPRRRELLLDNTGSILRRMEDYRQQKKSGRYIHIFDTDSDDEDLEEDLFS